MTTKHRQTAGGVVINKGGEIIVVNQNGNSWSLPKGGVENGESSLKAAIREVREETGMENLELVKELGSYERCRIGKGGIGEDCSRILHITMFLFRSDKIELIPEDLKENPEARWVDINKVVEFLTHKKDKEFFESIKAEIT